jgi:hypothetical protein
VLKFSSRVSQSAFLSSSTYTIYHVPYNHQSLHSIPIPKILGSWPCGHEVHGDWIKAMVTAAIICTSYQCRAHCAPAGKWASSEWGGVHHLRSHQISTLQLNNLPHAHPVSSFLCQGIDCPSPPAQKRSTCNDLTVCSIILWSAPPICFLGGPH